MSNLIDGFRVPSFPCTSLWNSMTPTDPPAFATGYTFRVRQLGTCGGGTHLVAVLGDIEVELTECTKDTEVAGMETGLLHQVGIHVLVTDGCHLRYVPVVPVGTIGRSLRQAAEKPKPCPGQQLA